MDRPGALYYWPDYCFKFRQRPDRPNISGRLSEIFRPAGGPARDSASWGAQKFPAEGLTLRPTQIGAKSPVRKSGSIAPSPPQRGFEPRSSKAGLDLRPCAADSSPAFSLWTVKTGPGPVPAPDSLRPADIFSIPPGCIPDSGLWKPPGRRWPQSG